MKNNPNVIFCSPSTSRLYIVLISFSLPLSVEMPLRYKSFFGHGLAAISTYASDAVAERRFG